MSMLGSQTEIRRRETNDKDFIGGLNKCRISRKFRVNSGSGFFGNFDEVNDTIDGL